MWTQYFPEEKNICIIVMNKLASCQNLSVVPTYEHAQLSKATHSRHKSFFWVFFLADFYLSTNHLPPSDTRRRSLNNAQAVGFARRKERGRA